MRVLRLDPSKVSVDLPVILALTFSITPLTALLFSRDDHDHRSVFLTHYTLEQLRSPSPRLVTIAEVAPHSGHAPSKGEVVCAAQTQGLTPG